jgi:hypothetical protein
MTVNEDEEIGMKVWEIDNIIKPRRGLLIGIAKLLLKVFIKIINRGY